MICADQTEVNICDVGTICTINILIRDTCSFKKARKGRCAKRVSCGLFHKFDSLEELNFTLTIFHKGYWIGNTKVTFYVWHGMRNGLKRNCGQIKTENGRPLFVGVAKRGGGWWLIYCESDVFRSFFIVWVFGRIRGVSFLQTTRNPKKLSS